MADSRRIRWADLAKGMCILLVVLRHVTNKQYRWLDWSGSAAHAVDVWQEVSVVLQPLRMPLFFLISGWFVARWLTRPLGSYLERRVLRPEYLFAMWIAVHGLIWLVLPPIHGVNRVEHWRDVPLELAWASSGIWYLYALGAFGLVARLTRRVPTLPLLVAAAALAVWASTEPFGALDGNRYQSLTNLIFFLFGARLPDLVKALGERALRHSTASVLALIAFVGLSLLATEYDLRSTAGVVFVLSTLGVAAGIAMSVIVDRVHPHFGRAGEWLGARTLPIYVLHVPLVALLDFALRRSGLETSLTSAPGSVALVTASIYPLLAVALVVGACVAINAVLAPRLPWFFELPPLRRRAAAQARPSQPAR